MQVTAVKCEVKTEDATTHLNGRHVWPPQGAWLEGETPGICDIKTETDVVEEMSDSIKIEIDVAEEMPKACKVEESEIDVPTVEEMSDSIKTETDVAEEMSHVWKTERDIQVEDKGTVGGRDVHDSCSHHSQPSWSPTDLGRPSLSPTDLDVEVPEADVKSSTGCVAIRGVDTATPVRLSARKGQKRKGEHVSSKPVLDVSGREDLLDEWLHTEIAKNKLLGKFHALWNRKLELQIAVLQSHSHR